MQVQVTASPSGRGPQVLSPRVLSVYVAVTTLPACPPTSWLQDSSEVLPGGLPLPHCCQVPAPPLRPGRGAVSSCLPLPPVVCAHDGDGTWISEPDEDGYKEGHVTSHIQDIRKPQQSMERVMC